MQTNAASRPTFTSLLHGELGRLFSSSLTISALGAWSQCDKNGHTITTYRFSHMKHFNMDLYQPLSPEVFAHLCCRLRGIECLEWSIDHPALFEASKWNDGSLQVDYRTHLEFYSQLLMGNRNTLRMITQKPPRDISRLQSYYRASYHVRNILFDIVPYFPHLEAIFTTYFIDNNFTQKFCKQQEMMNRTSDKRGEASKVSSMNAQVQRKECIKLMNPLSRTKPLLTEGDYQTYANMSPHQSTPLQPYTLTSLRIMQSFKFSLISFEIAVDVLTAIESMECMLEVQDTELDEFIKTRHCINVVSEMKSWIGFQLKDKRECILPLWENILYLALNIDEFALPPMTKLSLHSPSLLGLTLFAEQQSNCSRLSDIVFQCPEALTLSIGLTCSHTADDDESDRYIPSFITSLRYSTKLRSLNYAVPNEDPYDDVDIQLVYIDWRKSLTTEEKQQAQARMKSVEHTYEPRTASTNKKIFYACLLYSCLSALPCGRTLEMIGTAPQYMSLSEYLTLFPAMRAVSVASAIKHSDTQEEDPIWVHPPAKHQLSTSDIIQDRIITACTENRAWEKNLEGCHDYLMFVDNRIRLENKYFPAFVKSGRFDQLHTLFLSAPTYVSSRAVTMLFTSCTQLKHASLMQLLDVGDEVFSDLSQDCIRPQLETLRIKTVGCKSVKKTFTSGIFPRLTHIFPDLQHFEFVSGVGIGSTAAPFSGVADDNPIRVLIHLLAEGVPVSSSSADAAVIPPVSGHILLRWHNLRTLIVNQSPFSTLTDKSQLHSMLIARRQMINRLSPTGSTVHQPYQLIYIRILSSPDLTLIDWHLPNRRPDLSVIQRPEWIQSNSTLHYLTEACCCAHHCHDIDHIQRAEFDEHVRGEEDRDENWDQHHDAD